MMCLRVVMDRRKNDAHTFQAETKYQSYDVEKNPFFLDNHLAPQHLFAAQCDHVLLFDDFTLALGFDL